MRLYFMADGSLQKVDGASSYAIVQARPGLPGIVYFPVSSRIFLSASMSNWSDPIRLERKAHCQLKGVDHAEHHPSSSRSPWHARTDLSRVHRPRCHGQVA